MKSRRSPLSPPEASGSIDGLPELKQWFRLDECSTIFAVSNTQVRNWIDEGVLDARAIASSMDARNLPKKVCKRVTRQSIVRLLNDTSRAI